MTAPALLFSFHGQAALGSSICKALKLEEGQCVAHQFPDGETVIRFDSEVQHREVIFLVSLNDPNAKILPLIFAAETARSLGANQIILIAPYLPYMRQDKIFEPGQGITSSYFAKLISFYFDALITLDPHLHRWHALNDLYTIPAILLHATENIARWIKTQVKIPLLIGPDEESKQWVELIAQKSNPPYLILKKMRKGDTEIEVSLPQLDNYPDATPILVDDIISSGKTMIATLLHLKTLGARPAICIGVHALFSEEAHQEMLEAHASAIITCNTIPHISNRIDISDKLVEGLKSKLDTTIHQDGKRTS